MKNIIKLFMVIVLVAVIGFLMTACLSDVVDEIKTVEVTTTGRITIIGLEAYEGKNISGSTYNGVPDLKACKTAYNERHKTSTGADHTVSKTTEPGIVVSGQAVLKVYHYKDMGNDGYYENYSGNDQSVDFSVDIFNSQNNSSRVWGNVTVNFSNGIGSGAFVPLD